MREAGADKEQDRGATASQSLAVSESEQLEQCRETNKRLNRRCQIAERAAKDTVEQNLRSDMSFGRMLANWAAGKYRQALLQVRAESQQLVGMEDPFGSQGPPMLVGANAYFALVDALGELSQEEARAELATGLYRPATATAVATEVSKPSDPPTSEPATEED